MRAVGLRRSPKRRRLWWSLSEGEDWREVRERGRISGRGGPVELARSSMELELSIKEKERRRGASRAQEEDRAMEQSTAEERVKVVGR